MTHFKNTAYRYGTGAIFLHWLIAIFILGQIFLGWYMTGPQGTPQLYGWHKQIGVFILMLAFIRVFWRSLNVSPSLDFLPSIERIAARTSHYLLYFFMFTVPLSGWLMSSATGHSVVFFGILLPPLISPNKSLGEIFVLIHTWFAYSLLTLVGLHAAAALKHHFIDKNDVLRRML